MMKILFIYLCPKDYDSIFVLFGEEQFSILENKFLQYVRPVEIRLTFADKDVCNF